MDVAGEHDMSRTQPGRGGHDTLANPRVIDAHDRSILEDPRPCPPRQCGEAMDVFAAIDLECLGIIHAMEIAVGPDLVAHALDLPALNSGIEILAEHLQAADQFVTRLDIGDFERAFTEVDARHQLFGRGGPYELRTIPGQRPQSTGVVEPDALDQLAERETIARHYRSKVVPGCIPADMTPFEHADAGSEPRRLKRHGQP